VAPARVTVASLVLPESPFAGALAVLVSFVISYRRDPRKLGISLMVTMDCYRRTKAWKDE